MAMVFCRGCGGEIHESAKSCPKCGAIQGDSSASGDSSDKSRLVALLLCWILGIFGAHRFYVGKIGTAIAQLFTLGGLFVWTFIDFIVIIVGSFRDADNKKLEKW